MGPDFFIVWVDQGRSGSCRTRKTAVRNINWNIMFQLIFPVVGSFFSLSLRSPMVMIRSPGVVLLLGFF